MTNLENVLNENGMLPTYADDINEQIQASIALKQYCMIYDLPEDSDIMNIIKERADMVSSLTTSQDRIMGYKMAVLTCQKMISEGCTLSDIIYAWNEKVTKIEGNKAGFMVYLDHLEEEDPATLTRIIESDELVSSGNLSIEEFADDVKDIIDITDDLSLYDTLHDKIQDKVKDLELERESERMIETRIAKYELDMENEEDVLVNYDEGSDIVSDFGYDPYWSDEYQAIEFDANGKTFWIVAENEGDPDEKKWHKSEILELMKQLDS